GEIFAARASPRSRGHQGLHVRLSRRVPDLNCWGAADLIAGGDYVVGQWEGGGTHTGPAFKDFLVGSLPAATGRKMRFTGTTVLKVIDGRIAEEVGLDDGVTALTQLGLLKAASQRRPLASGAARRSGAVFDPDTIARCLVCNCSFRRCSGSCC